MLRNTTLLLGLLLLLALFVSEPGPRPPEATPTSAPKTETTAMTVAVPDAGPPAKAPAPAAQDKSLLAELLAHDEVPALPKGAPQSVKFGVVLITYQEAEFAPKQTRTKAEALAKAKELLQVAQSDFAEAVKQGDPGSLAKAGRMPRGVLEPALEYVLFTLEQGQVFDEPIDTARGYWLLKRL